MQHYIAVYIAITRLHKSSFTFNTLFCSCTLPSNAQLPGLLQTDSYSDYYYYYYVLHMQSRAGPRELNKQKPKSNNRELTCMSVHLITSQQLVPTLNPQVRFLFFHTVFFHASFAGTCLNAHLCLLHAKTANINRT